MARDYDKRGIFSTVTNEEEDSFLVSDDIGTYMDSERQDEIFTQESLKIRKNEKVENFEDLKKKGKEKGILVENLFENIEKFLMNAENQKYLRKIKQMCVDNKESFYIKYSVLEKHCPEVIDKLITETELVIKICEEALMKIVLNYFPKYNLIFARIHLRIVDLPITESIRNLRNIHLNTLIRVSGVVTRRSIVYPLLSIAKFFCLSCRSTFGPFVIEKDGQLPLKCLECQKNGPFQVNSEETIYKNFQKITIQELPSAVPSGSLPRQQEVLLFYDLIDSCKPGDEIDISGIYQNTYSLSLSFKTGFPIFFTVIDAIAVTKKEKIQNDELTEDDLYLIKKMSKNPRILQIIYNSIAPSIYGHPEIKKAIALSLFGGMEKISKEHRVRGDINVLMIGDPGTAKSQFLRYAMQTSPKAVLTSGQGASSVGLTATVKRDVVTKEWCLEGGALVIADRGHCLIDEFDKMNDRDRTSIHEAMEQQSISISKAGIVSTLNARCGVIAAANPTRGTYNSALNFVQNTNLSDPIISRFDILCVVKDNINEESDNRMAEFVINEHFEERQNTYEDESPFDQEKMMFSQSFFKKYLSYARNNKKVEFKQLNKDKISQLYSELRKESMKAGGIPITVRQIESIIRISEAYACMQLKKDVDESDINRAIEVVLDSFISTQKNVHSKTISDKFKKFYTTKDLSALYLYILNEMFKQQIKIKNDVNISTVKIADFEKRLKFLKIDFNSRFYQSEKMRAGGFIFNEHEKTIRKRTEYH